MELAGDATRLRGHMRPCERVVEDVLLQRADEADLVPHPGLRLRFVQGNEAARFGCELQRCGGAWPGG